MDNTLIFYAAVYTLLVWLIAAAAKLLVYLALSVDDFQDLLIAALSHSAAAMWLPPAILLLSTHSPAESALGILLIANTARILIARRAPRVRGPAEGEKRKAAPSWLVIGALLFQAALCAWWLEYPVAAAALLALTVSLWTAAYLNSGASRPAKPITLGRSVATIIATLLLATILTAAQLSRSLAATVQPGFLETSQAIAARLTEKPRTASRALDKNRIARIVTSTLPDGVPGVILRPKAAPKQKAAVSTRAFHFSSFHPVTFHFTGDYHLFPASSVEVPVDSAIREGTPLNQVYGTVGGTSVATEAYQKLDPPFDFTVCGRIQLTLRNAEMCRSGPNCS